MNHNDPEGLKNYYEQQAMEWDSKARKAKNDTEKKKAEKEAQGYWKEVRSLETQIRNKRYNDYDPPSGGGSKNNDSSSGARPVYGANGNIAYWTKK